MTTATPANPFRSRLVALDANCRKLVPEFSDVAAPLKRAEVGVSRPCLACRGSLLMTDIAGAHPRPQERVLMPLSEPPPAAQDLQRGGGFRVSAGRRRSLLLVPAHQAEPSRWSDPVRLRTLSCGEPEPAGQGLMGAESIQLFIAGDPDRSGDRGAFERTR